MTKTKMNVPWTCCDLCGATDNIHILTYKRDWYLCQKCGSAQPVRRNSYPFRFLPYEDLKHQTHLDAQKMYDYFTSEVHISCAIEEAEEFHQKYIAGNGWELTGKTILDVSGGNGFFIKKYQEMGNRVVLTEINSRALDYARQHHQFDGVFFYDLNKDRLDQLTDMRFDVIMARACIMFCNDVADFARQCRDILTPGGLVIVERSTEPTLGTLVRVQLDEFTYHYLRQPPMVIDAFIAEGFILQWRQDEVDPSLYVYDHDLLGYWMMLHYLYEIPGARKLMKKRLFNFPARDRRRSTMFFRLNG
jgi:2-polyprenyl-3-methyl-5-hydroxy-6-metoxy-1,4-benzoquinol methylase